MNRTRPEPPIQEGLERDIRQPFSKGIREEESQPQLRSKLLTWSSVDEDGLNRYQAALGAFFASPSGNVLDEEEVNDIVYTLCHKRTHFLWRRSLLFTSLHDLQSQLFQSPSLHTAKSVQGRRVAFVFTGQGAQYASMGHGLMQYFQEFQNSIAQSQEFLRAMGCDWKLEDVMMQQHHREGVCDMIHEPQYSQPACTALQIALVDLIWSFGIKPTAVVGHSSGEIAAACVLCFTETFFETMG